MFPPKAAAGTILARRWFRLPQCYRPDTTRVELLPFGRKMAIWLNSLRPNRLRELQRQLIDLHFPQAHNAPSEEMGVTVEEKTTPIDSENSLNEVVFRVQNDASYPTRHIVFIHGYGASLGCFARNFHLVDELKGEKANFVVHFLDNISFGLSSNPKLHGVGYWRPIPKIDFLNLGPAENPPVFHKKYYQLLEYFEVDPEKQRLHAEKMGPVLLDMEDYYVEALEKWRRTWGIQQIDCLVGHSFGGYWSGCYAIKHAASLRNLVLLSPVGVERHAAAITVANLEGTDALGERLKEADVLELGAEKRVRCTPLLDPTRYAFLGKFPNLSHKTVEFWYNVQPYLPRLLRLMGPFGVDKYYKMWYSKLFAIHGVVKKLGGAEKVFSSEKQLVFGSNEEVLLLIEYLYNSITSGTRSDIHVKYLLTPATTSRWPLFDKFMAAEKLPVCHFAYGEFDFMCSEAGQKLAEKLGENGHLAAYHEVPQGGHNLYIQNPFGTNEFLLDVFKGGKNEKRETV